MPLPLIAVQSCRRETFDLIVRWGPGEGVRGRRPVGPEHHAASGGESLVGFGSTALAL